MVKPGIIVIAHTATSYYLGRAREARNSRPAERKRAARGSSTAFGSVVAALERLGVRRVALGAPYSAETTPQGQRASRSARPRLCEPQNLKGVTNIYDETAERAYGLARLVDRPEAEAVFLSGTGMPTLPVLELLEQDLRKPAISSASAMMWHALRCCGVNQPIPAYGRLLTSE